jgi:hypothetical protein
MAFKYNRKVFPSAYILNNFYKCEMNNCTEINLFHLKYLSFRVTCSTDQHLTKLSRV